MLEILADCTYRHLFTAQAVALLGTGLTPAALGLLAYDLERIVGPMLAALLLAVMRQNFLFLGTVAGFAPSAAPLVLVLLPRPKFPAPRGIYDRTTRSIRILPATPRLRRLL